MSRPRLLDLFSGAGGSATGYDRAGFEVVGVDIESQKNYPFRFIQGDALEYVRAHGHEYDAIHASPPCQIHTCMIKGTLRDKPHSHVDMIPITRRLLRLTGQPYVIENVMTAPMERSIVLCGATFGLRVYRHRSFESNICLLAPPHLRHTIRCARQGSYPRDGISFMTVTGRGGHVDRWTKWVESARECMGIAWMDGPEITQAIPPAFTEFIGTQLIGVLERAA